MAFEVALLAYVFDHLFGEFPWKHPVQFMGDFIKTYEQRFYRNNCLAGLGLVVSLLLITFLLSIAIEYSCAILPEPFALLGLALFSSSGLAMKMLHQSVAEILSTQNPKQTIAYLVSRDTDAMTETDIIKAALETWAENLSDGVIAPLFYLLLFGLPGIAVYKAINTLDSMVGYKTPSYFYFGKTAAILDDIANFIPARLTALLLILLSKNKASAWHFAWQDGHKLESPNAGFPIAALAGSLGVALGGDAYYHGKMKHKPTLGHPLNPLTKNTLKQSLALKSAIDCTLISVLISGVLIA